jgi:RNA polymerase sigma factor (sigma-70 family)
MRSATSHRRPLPLLHVSAWQELADTELLRRYVVGREEDAFTELVRRHGPLVLRACRHGAGETAAAEDAFQATFLLLLRKAERLGGRGSLAGWLHGAGVRIARDARRAEDRRRRREQARTAPQPTSVEDVTWREVRQRLDAELAALPEKYRLPLVLCYVQDLTYEQAARRVPCKKLLRQRLARYGLPLAAPLLVLSQPPAVSAALRQTTHATVRAGLAGRPVAPAVAALVSSSRGWKLALATLLLILGVTAGMGLAMHGLSPAPPHQPALPTAPLSGPEAGGPQGPPPADARNDPLPPGAVARLGTRRFQVSTFPLLPWSVSDGKAYLIYQPEAHGRLRGGDFQWMDADTGKVFDTWPVPEGQYPSYRAPVGVSADGRWLLLADQRVVTTGVQLGAPQKPNPNFALSLYDLSVKKEVKVLHGVYEREGEWAVTGCRFSADGKWLVTTGGEIRMWKLATGKVVWLRQQGNGGEQAWEPLGFTANSTQLIVQGCRDGTIYVVDTAEGQVVRQFPVDLKGHWGAAWLSPDGTTVLMHLQTPDIRQWDLKTGKELPPLTGHKQPISTLAYSLDGKTLVSAGTDAYVLVRDWPSGKVRRQFDLGRGRPVYHLFVSADGRTLNVLFRQEKTLHRYDLDLGKPLSLPIDTHWGDVCGIALAPDGCVVSLGRDNVLRTWDQAKYQQVHHVRLDPAACGEGPFGLSPDGKLVAFADANEKSIVIFDKNAGKPVRKIVVAGGHLDRVAFSPDGRLVAGTGRDAATVGVWDAKTGELVAQLPAQQGGWWTGAPAFAFSPDSKLLLTTTGGRVHFWETTTWKACGQVEESTSMLALSPDGRMLACPCLHVVTVWEVATRKKRLELPAHAHPSWLAQFSPDGRYLAWTTFADTVEVWDVVLAERVGLFEGHDGPIKGLTFSRDGRHLVTASTDCTLLVWEVKAAGHK